MRTTCHLLLALLIGCRGAREPRERRRDAGMAERPRAEPGAVVGRLRGPDGRGLAGKTIRAVQDLLADPLVPTSEWRALSPHVVTQGEGRFRIPTDRPIWLTLDDPVLVSEQIVRLEPGAPPVDLRAVRGERLEGRVLWRSGRPAVGARVDAVPAVEHGTLLRGDAVVDAAGEFQTQPLRPGRYAVLVVGDGGARGSAAVTTRARVSVELPELARVRGRVVADRGTPPGVTVAGEPTAPDGTFNLELSHERDAIEVAAPGMAPRSVALELREAETRDLGEIRLEREAIAGGVVVDREGRAVADALVTVETADGDRALGGASTDPEGRFRIAGLASGPARLSAADTRRGGSPAIRTTLVAGRARTDLRLSLTEARFLRGTATLEGRPPARAFVTVASRGGVLGPVRLERDGRFVAGPVGEGPVSIYVRDCAHHSATVRTSVGSVDPDPMRFELVADPTPETRRFAGCERPDRWEERSVSSIEPDCLTVRFAVVGEHARRALQRVREDFSADLRDETWSADPGGRDVLDLGLDLRVGGRPICLAVHALPTPATYEDPAGWPLYGGLVLAAGTGDPAALDTMVEAFRANDLPVWSARAGSEVASAERGPAHELRLASTRSALRELTRAALDRFAADRNAAP